MPVGRASGRADRHRIKPHVAAAEASSAMLVPNIERPRRNQERGFTLIELLVVILIIGILVGVGVPSLLGQRMRAYGASAKQMASNAQTDAETIASDHEGVFGKEGASFVSPGAIHEYDRTIPTSQGASNGGPWLSTATDTDEGGGYIVTTTAPKAGGETFSVERTPEGAVVRTCAPVSVANGCANGSW